MGDVKYMLRSSVMHIVIQFIWESFAHRDQQKYMFKIFYPQTAEVTNVMF